MHGDPAADSPTTPRDTTRSEERGLRRHGRPRRVLIIEAAADTCVPQTARERLWQAMGRPERIAYLYDHREAFLAMTSLGGHNLQQQIYRFLDRRFPVASDPAAFATARAGASSRLPQLDRQWWLGNGVRASAGACAGAPSRRQRRQLVADVFDVRALSRDCSS